MPHHTQETEQKLSMEVELGSNDGNVRFRDWNYNAYHAVFIKSKYFVAAKAPGEKWKGFAVRLNGGNDKEGSPSKQ